MSTVLGRRRKAKDEGAVKEVKEEVKKLEKATVKEAKKAEKAVEHRLGRPMVRPSRPTGRVPQAMVTARHGSGMITRSGRGFSLGELAGVGLAPGLAAEWGVRIDARRRSVLDGNVASLKTWHATAGTRERVEHEAKKAEQELAKVGKEVEKEAVAVEKEVVKAAKKEVKRAEKAVKEKAEKPKARPKKKEKA